MHVVGWLQRPALDRNTATVYWALEGANPEHHVVNSIALRLGRDGYERVNWIVDKADYQSVGGQLDVMLRAHSFDQGHRYADHTSGDTIAGTRSRRRWGQGREGRRGCRPAGPVEEIRGSDLRGRRGCDRSYRPPHQELAPKVASRVMARAQPVRPATSRILPTRSR